MTSDKFLATNLKIFVRLCLFPNEINIYPREIDTCKLMKNAFKIKRYPSYIFI